MKKAVIYVLIAVYWILPCFADETTIYTWTDNNGVKRFSDRQPDEVKHYDTIRISPNQSKYGDPTGGSRPEYDQMIENLKQEKQQTEQVRMQAEADRNVKEKLETDVRMKERIEAERKQLQEKIDDLKKRPTGRTYSQSLKNTQIGEIEKQLDKLKNSPDEYFQGK